MTVIPLSGSNCCPLQENVKNFPGAIPEPLAKTGLLIVFGLWRILQSQLVYLL
jgi:hypothetical protein